MKRLRVEYVANGVVRAQDASLTVFTTAYSFNRKPLDLGKYSDVDYRLSPEDLKFIKKCTVKKARVFSRSGPDLLGGAVSHPRDRHFITSPFWSKRLIKRYRIRKGRKISFGNKTNVHGGTDFRGKKGAPVFAMACGEVAIAEPMYYEGNFVVIDHGNGVFSHYMHLDGITVKEGDRVRAGGLIGRVGSTGLSTASHLHVSLRAQNVYVEPLSILSLPIRE
ncbi:MAG: M23 family metallopeptidase [Chrysiogenales bacterium]|nr:MAG: M23 family metallopeptidase [Chrysiogenales bacterium]